jgi:hypothetical protein
MKFIINMLLLIIAAMTLLMVLFFVARGCESAGGSMWNAVKDVEIPRTSWIVDGDADGEQMPDTTREAFKRGYKAASEGKPLFPSNSNGD